MKNPRIHNYELVKFFADTRPPEVVRSGLTLEQAQSACNAPSTRKEGEWFTGYRETHSAKRDALGDTTRRGTPSITKALLAARHGLGAGRAKSGQFDY